MLVLSKISDEDSPLDFLENVCAVRTEVPLTSVM
jgi:hypothetical protein